MQQWGWSMTNLPAYVLHYKRTGQCQQQSIQWVLLTLAAVSREPLPTVQSHSAYRPVRKWDSSTVSSSWVILSTDRVTNVHPLHKTGHINIKNAYTDGFYMDGYMDRQIGVLVDECMQHARNCMDIRMYGGMWVNGLAEWISDWRGITSMLQNSPVVPVSCCRIFCTLCSL